MQIITEIASVKELKRPISLTIGFFDGVHRGHQKVLQKNRKEGTSVCVTFRNHPSTLLTPKEPTPLICSTSPRISLLEKQGVNLLLLLDFDEELANLTAKSFLLILRQAIPFQSLVLGHDAHLGRKREGSPKLIGQIAKEEGFHLTYTDSLLYQEKPISSSQVRTAIKQGNLPLTQQLLGRKLSYFGTIIEGPHKGREIGYPTANIPLPGLVLPPFGVYAASMGTHQGIANVGVAPTLHEDRVPMLEVHLFDFDENLYGQQVEVTLHHFIRPEKKFTSINTLKSQITADIISAIKLLI